MDLKNIIEKKDEYAQYMLDEITHICKDMEKRTHEQRSSREKEAAFSSCGFDGRFYDYDTGKGRVLLQFAVKF